MIRGLINLITSGRFPIKRGFTFKAFLPDGSSKQHYCIIINKKVTKNTTVYYFYMTSQKEKVIREIDKLDKLSEKEVKDNLKKYGAEKVLSIIKKDEEYFEEYESYYEIKELKKYLKIYNVKVEFSPSLSRGLSYYNSTVFEIKTKKMKETIVGGGAYNFNNTQCVGISFGLERLSSLADIEIKEDKYLIVSLNQDKESISLIKKIRKTNNATIFYGKPSKALDYANSYNYNKVIFVGEKEVKQNKFKVKDMKTGKESSLKL